MDGAPRANPFKGAHSPARPVPISAGAAFLSATAPHRALWAITAMLICADAVWLFWAGIALEPLGFTLAGGIAAALFAAGAYWVLMKHEPTLRAMAHSSAVLLTFTLAVAVFHYLTATLSPPLIDPQLAAMEAALGFDWIGHIGSVRGRPALERALAFAYHSSAAQMALVVIVLSATLRLARLADFVHLFAATLIVVIGISALAPALGPYAFHGIPVSAEAGVETVGATWHLEPLNQLRRGDLDSIALGGMRGLATFPSFHVCLAIITAWALAPIRVLGPIAIVVNAAVIVGTISAGGHYLPDVLAGALLTAAAFAARAFWRREGSPADHSAGARPAWSRRSARTKSAVMRAPS